MLVDAGGVQKQDLPPDEIGRGRLLRLPTPLD